MANILISQLTAATPQATDLLIFANPTTGLAKKMTIADFRTTFSIPSTANPDAGFYPFLSATEPNIFESSGLKQAANGGLILADNGNFTERESAILVLNSTTKGFLLPQLTTTQRDAIVNPRNGIMVYNLTTSFLNYYNGAAWTTINVGASSITTLNTLTASTQTFATSTTGTDFTITSATSTHTFNLPSASAANRGLLTAADWTTFNNKQTALVSGTNIKTINGASILGSGNIVISGGTGLTSLNGLTAGTQLFAVASTGTDFTISSTTDTHTFAIPTASASARGLLSSANWTTFNGKVGYTGATADLNLGVYNLFTNNIFTGFTSVAASGTLITLTVTSTPYYNVTGSGGQIIKLPDATTLQNGASFVFNNNQSSGAITINNNSNTLIASIPSGGYVTITLLSNSIAAGSWDRHFEAPSNVSWSTNTFDYAGSITSATWNGVSITDTYISSAATWNGKQAALNGTGFVKISGTTISYDNTTYLSSITSGNVTTALGFTPYNATNPSNFIALTSLSFAAGSGAYNSATGVITIPTNNTQITNGAGYITTNQSITLSGDVTGTGTTAITSTLTTVTQASSGNFVKVTLDTKGRVTGNTAVVAADITALGFAVSTITTNRQTASYTLVLADANKLVEMNVATANTLTVPTNATVAFPIGTQILIAQYGAGAATITAASGVTLRSESAKLKTNGQYAGATIVKIATDEWYAFGNLIA